MPRFLSSPLQVLPRIPLGSGPQPGHRQGLSKGTPSLGRHASSSGLRCSGVPRTAVRRTAAPRLLPTTKMAARGPCQHEAALLSRARLYDWRRARPRDAFNSAARDLRREGARPRRGCAGDQVTPAPTPAAAGARPTPPSAGRAGPPRRRGARHPGRPGGGAAGRDAGTGGGGGGLRAALPAGREEAACGPLSLPRPVSPRRRGERGSLRNADVWLNSALRSSGTRRQVRGAGCCPGRRAGGVRGPSGGRCNRGAVRSAGEGVLRVALKSSRSKGREERGAMVVGLGLLAVCLGHPVAKFCRAPPRGDSCLLGGGGGTGTAKINNAPKLLSQ